MKFTKNLPVYVLSGALIFVGVVSASQAQAAWTSKETSRVKTLEVKVQQLERLLSSQDLNSTKVQQIEKLLATQELVTVRYLATGGSGGTYGDICPGNENLDFGGGNASYIGRLSPKTDILGRPVTDIRGEAISAYVYACKIQFYAKKSN